MLFCLTLTFKDNPQEQPKNFSSKSTKNMCVRCVVLLYIQLASFMECVHTQHLNTKYLQLTIDFSAPFLLAAGISTCNTTAQTFVLCFCIFVILLLFLLRRFELHSDLISFSVHKKQSNESFSQIYFLV